MKEINVKTTVEIDPKDINIDCRTASSYCPPDLSCFKCPFGTVGDLDLAEILSKYLEILAEVKDAAD